MIHDLLVKRGYGFIEKDGTTYYAIRNIAIDAETFSGDYDLRAFLALFRGTQSEDVKRLLFEHAIPCCYCIDDKCTTLLMAHARTIEYGGRQKKLCGPYRHRLTVPLDAPEDALQEIVEMMLEYTHPYMQMEKPKEMPRYESAAERGYTAHGFVHHHTLLSASDEAFIEKTRPRLGPAERYVGVIMNFVDGSHYDFFFGAVAPEAEVPGAEVLEVPGGQYEVYRGDVHSIWGHFTSRQDVRFDARRDAYEVYGGADEPESVHIPVGGQGGLITRIRHAPDSALIGFRTYAEADHPEYVERPFDAWREVENRFPRAGYICRASIHALFGKPLMGFDGAPYDAGTQVYEDMEVFTLTGGLEHRAGFRHFTGDYEAWGEALSTAHELDHPRAFNRYIYPARGGYSEIGVPICVPNKRSYEVMMLPPLPLRGKYEAPPDSYVTDAEMAMFASAEDNAEMGSSYIAYTLTHIETQNNTGDAFYDKPLFKGYHARAGIDAHLRGGRYVRASEAGLNGVMGWEAGALEQEALKKTGTTLDESRPFIYKQMEYGRKYELYIPVI